MHPTFAISGFGRSGTLWLANLLNRSAVWKVAHEPSAEYHLDPLAARFRDESFAQPYGEVNSFLLYSLADLDVTHRAVIVRDPIDICLSYANRNPQEPIDGSFLHHLAASLAVIDRLITQPLWIGSRVPPISFKHMTRDVDYLRDISARMGVTDVMFGEADLLEKVNSSGRETVASWWDWDEQTRKKIGMAVQWFRDRHEHMMEWMERR